MVNSLLGHKRYAELFVEGGGLSALLALPRVPLTHGGLALCLAAIANLPLAMERVCALPAPAVNQVGHLMVINARDRDFHQNSGLVVILPGPG